MVLFRYLTIGLLLIQVFTSRATQARFVVGSEGHLDSGQEEEERTGWRFLGYDLSQEDDDSEEYFASDEDYGQEIDNYQSEENDVDEGIWWWSGGDDYSEELYEEDEEENDSEERWKNDEKSSFYLPLKRVRRRIIPIGKALDRDRVSTDRNDPYGRNRSPWARPPGRDPVMKRTGPTGSAALFSLYPELAPPEWREIYGRKKSKRRNRSQQEDRESNIHDRQMGDATRERGAEEHTGNISYSPKKSRVSHDVGKKAPRKKLRLTKDMKEDIAIFAKQHGAERAVDHFRIKLKAPIRIGTVNKYLRRYENRQIRRGNRTDRRA